MELLDEQAVQALHAFFDQAPLPDRVALFLQTQFSVLESGDSLAIR